MPCTPQKQPPATTAVWDPVASAAGVSSAGAGITLLMASAPTWQAHPNVASVRAAAVVLILVFIENLPLKSEGRLEAPLLAFIIRVWETPRIPWEAKKRGPMTPPT